MSWGLVWRMVTLLAALSVLANRFATPAHGLLITGLPGGASSLVAQDDCSSITDPAVCCYDNVAPNEFTLCCGTGSSCSPPGNLAPPIPTLNEVATEGADYTGATSAGTALKVCDNPSNPTCTGVAHWAWYCNGSDCRFEYRDASGTPSTWKVDVYAGQPFTIARSTQPTTFEVSNTENVAKALTLRSLASDPADSGWLQLGNAQALCWEASPAGTDQCLSVNASEQLTSTAQVTAPTLRSQTTNTATSGWLQLANGEQVCWESSPVGTDNCLTVNASEQLTFNGAAVGGGSSAVVQTMEWGCDDPAGGGTTYLRGDLNLGGACVASPGSTAAVNHRIARAGQTCNLKCTAATAPGAGTTWTFTLHHTGAATALSCAMAPGETYCEDLTPGDCITTAEHDSIRVPYTETGTAFDGAALHCSAENSGVAP